MHTTPALHVSSPVKGAVTAGLLALGAFLPVSAAPAAGILLAGELPAGQTGAKPLPTMFGANAFHYQALRPFPKTEAAIYRAAVPAAGKYALWLRYRAQQPAATAYAVRGPDQAAPAGLPAAAEFAWTKLGLVELSAGEQAVYLFGGGFETDALWLGAENATPPNEAPRIERPRTVLPPLVHTGKITEHPRWIFETVRVAFAHWEREKPMAIDDWARTMKEYGATALMALGNVPDIPVAAAAPDLEQRAREQAEKLRNWKPGYGWVKEYVEAAHRHGLRCTIYSEQLSNLDEILKEHPDWCEKTEAGDSFGSQPCFSSPYWDEFIQRMVMIAQTGCDGIVMDMLGFGNGAAGCRNPYCLEAFEKKFGVPAPDYIDPQDPVYQRWIEFQSHVREENLLRLTEAVHRVNPDFAVIVNQNRGWHFDLLTRHLSSRLPACVDGLLEETGWEDRHPLTLSRPLAFPLKDSFMNAYMRSRIGTGKGFMWHLTAAEPEVELRARNLNMLAHGVVPNPLTGPPLAWRRELWDDIRAREESVLGATALPWLGLVYSENTLAWRYGAVDENRARPYVESLWGGFQVAAEGRFPTDVLSDWQLTPENLRRYRVIVLPNTAALSDAAVAALRQYVREGGGLVATFETSLGDETAQSRADFGLADVFGTSWSGRASAPGVAFDLSASQHQIAQDEAIRSMGEWRQGAVKPRSEFRLTTGRPEMVLGYAVPKGAGPDGGAEGKQVLFAPMMALFGAGKLENAPQGFPAFFARQYGAGRVVYFPADITRAYFLKNSPATQALLTRAIRWAAKGAPPVEIDGNYQVEATYFTKDKTVYVHLLNDAGGFGRAAPPNPESYGYRKDVVPLVDLPVRLNRPVKRVRLLPGGDELRLRRGDGETRVVVPRLGLHAVLVLEND